MARVNTATDALPSLPQALIPVLDATQAAEADFQALGDAILQDTGMATRLLAAANSPFYYRGSACQSVDRALLTLGLDTVRGLALTAAIQQLFGQFQPRHRGYLREVWRRSLATAHLARVLATLTRYPHPDDAYLAGLLVELGRLVRLSRDEPRYWPMLQAAADEATLLQSETETYGDRHCDLGAELIEAWGLGSFLADAVRYHLEPVAAILDAHHLVKIVNLAYQLGVGTAAHTGETTSEDDAALAAADALFGLNEGLSRELRGRIDTDVARLAGALGIDLGAEPGEPTDADRDADQALGTRIRDLTELGQLGGELARSRDLQAQCTAARRTLHLTLGVTQSLLFVTDPDGGSVSSWIADDEAPDFTLPLLPGRSLVTDTLLDREIRLHERDTHIPAPVVDRQLFGLCGTEVLWSFPLIAEDSTPAGVLILGLSREQAEELKPRTAFIRALTREIARALARPPEASGAQPDDQERRIRETVHEAGNPLSIIQNYLGVLRMKLGEDHEARHELDLVKEEIDRVGRILLRLRDPETDAPGDTPADLNTLVRQVAEIVDGSLCRTRGIHLHLDLTAADPPLTVPADHVRQILTNVLKNAAEALDNGGEIRVETRAPVTINGRRITLLAISDNGPGLPAEVRDARFAPVASAKGEGHSGLGLSIAKRLADEIGATLECTSESEGTRFEIGLPQRDASTGRAPGHHQG